MRSLTLSLAMAMGLTLIFAGTLVDPTSAHSTAGWYLGRSWVRDKSISYAWTGQLPSTAWRPPIINAASTWNRVGTTLTFYEAAAGIGHAYAACPATYQDNGIWYRTLAAGVLANQQPCVYSNGELFASQITIAKGVSYYLGTGTPSSTQYDLQAVATHEFGHATGWYYHWDDPGKGGAFYCSQNGDTVNPTRHTMCAVTPRGSRMMRTLAPHDIDTFQNVYH